jgi:hypothetical protein
MEAKPRLPTSHNAAKSKGHLLQARVMPGRHVVTDGSGARTQTESPHQYTMPQQVRGSATHPDAMKRDISASEQCFGFAKTARKATKREPTASSNA